jgi:hypothetical protein
MINMIKKIYDNNIEESFVWYYSSRFFLMHLLARDVHITLKRLKVNEILIL